MEAARSSETQMNNYNRHVFMPHTFTSNAVKTASHTKHNKSLPIYYIPKQWLLNCTRQCPWQMEGVYLTGRAI